MSRTIPFWRTVGQSYALTFQNAGLLARLSWAWLLITGPLLFAFEFLISAGWLGALVQVTRDADVMPIGGKFLLYMVLQTVLIMPMLASVAVAWHRKLLLGEAPKSGIYLRCDGLVRRYGIVAAAITVASYVACSLAIDVAISDVMAGRLWVVVPLTVVTISAATYVATRLWTILPHFALEPAQARAMDGWHGSYGQFWRLFLGGLLVFALSFGAGMLLILVLPDASSGPLAEAASSTLQTLVMSTLLTFPGVTYLSLTYRALVGAPDAP